MSAPLHRSPAVGRHASRPTPPPSLPPHPIESQDVERVLRLAQRMAGPKSRLTEDFEEAAIDGLMAAAKSFHRVDCLFSTWSRACARRKILERSRSLRALKRGGGKEFFGLENGYQIGVWDPDYHAPSFDELVEPLEPAVRELLSLRFVDDLRFEAIADVVGTHERSVRRKILRSLDRLKTVLRAA